MERVVTVGVDWARTVARMLAWDTKEVIGTASSFSIA